MTVSFFFAYSVSRIVASPSTRRSISKFCFPITISLTTPPTRNVLKPRSFDISPINLSSSKISFGKDLFIKKLMFLFLGFVSNCIFVSSWNSFFSRISLVMIPKKGLHLRPEKSPGLLFLKVSKVERYTYWKLQL